MHEPIGSDKATSTVTGINGGLHMQARDDKSPQLTLTVSNADALAELYRDTANCKSAFAEVTQVDIVLAAISAIQQSAMMLNVNAFIASAYHLVPNYSHGLILGALSQLFQWVDIGIPTSDLETILDELQGW